MGSRNRNNPSRISLRNGNISKQQYTDMAHVPGFQGYPAGSAHNVHVDAMPLRDDGASSASMDRRTYLSSGRVQQWAASNEPGPHVLPKQRSARNTSLSLDMTNVQAMLPIDDTIPGSFSLSQFDPSHLSLPVSNGVYPPMDYSSSLSSTALYASASVHPGSGISTPFVFHGPSASHFDALTEGTWPADGEQSHPASVPFDDLYTDSPNLPYNLNGNSGGNSDYLTNWPYGSMAPAEAFLGVGEAPPMHAISMSPLSSATADLSVSSSYSPSSLLAPPSGSPISSITHGDDSYMDTNMIADEDCGASPQFTIGDAMLASITPDYSNDQEHLSRSVPTAVSPSDSGTVTEGFCRTIRPSRSSQRPIIASMGPVASTHQFEEMYMVSPTGDALRRRSNGEIDAAPAREHELYHAVPRDDGLYHCPYEGQDTCAHKPTKLKCNYDKNVDSHLKPYRCKILACGDTRFSSTACLLRHEREAHGMHGHGAKPHLCTYEDCERSIPGNGFPRRWNLYDHMRRVHDYTGAPSSNGSASPALSSSSSQYQSTNGQAYRKRKTSAASDTQPPRKNKPAAMARSRSDMRRLPTSSATQEKQLQNMEKEWRDHQARLRHRMDYLQDPNDSLSLEQITADMAVLRTIAMNIRRLRAGQLANEETHYGSG
ncbi:MAG: hypothetical protein M1830_002564 [Pleopsidium flavum]|nr:MAG: hypothetical protein M1830_002564 [Pleopsidium flavum]